jgi:predicted transcriptional regulator
MKSLRRQLAEIQIQRMQNEIATLRNQLAEVQSLHQAEAGVMEYLATQTEPVDEDRIHAAVKNRRATLLKALRRLVQDGKVNTDRSWQKRRSLSV